MTFRGTHNGDLEEIRFVKDFNMNKEKYYSYLNSFSKHSKLSNIWMVRVTTKQPSKLSNRKVFTRADSYLVKSLEINISFLIDNDYYLDEDLLNDNKIKFIQIPKSGVSIKMSNSKSFQILKLVPNSFKKLFGSYELGAGASLYCQNNSDLIKNQELIYGWNSTIEEMTKYFKQFTNNDINFIINKKVCKKIKSFSCKSISRQINNTEKLQKVVFNGEGIYQEPYSAYYLYQDSCLTKLKNIPFNVTTGSGRSRGNYTIVLKPK